MSEPKFDVDVAEQEFEAAKAAREAGDVEQQPGAEDDAGGGEGGEREDPPTYMTHEEWVAAGRDPEDYIGKKAFQKRHDDIQDNKKLRRDLKTMGKTVKQTMDAVNEWQGTERAKIKAELEADLHTAKENEDVNAAIDVQKKLDNLETDPPPADVEEHPIIQDFRDDNPMTDRGSDEYDEEFTADVEAIYNGMAQQLGHGGKRALTDGQVKRCLKKALKEARELHDIDDTPPAGDDDKDDKTDKGESPRNQRPTGQQRSTRRRASKGGDEPPPAEKYDLSSKFKNTNPRNVNAASQIRDTIRSTAEKHARKLGKNDADIKKAGDTAAKNFERSIA